MKEKHGTPYRYALGCRCIPCEDYYRVYQAMRNRKRYRGYLYIRHGGIIEQRYPDALEKWIKRKIGTR